MAQDVVADPVLKNDGIADAGWPGEPMHPADSGKADAPAAQLSELLVEVTLLASEPAEVRMKSGPGATSTAKCAQPLHGNLKLGCIGISAAGIVRPRAPHLIAPHGLEVGRQAAPVVVEQRTLDQIVGVGARAEIAPQAIDRAWNEED